MSTDLAVMSFNEAAGFTRRKLVIAAPHALEGLQLQ